MRSDTQFHTVRNPSESTRYTSQLAASTCMALKRTRLSFLSIFLLAPLRLSQTLTVMSLEMDSMTPSCGSATICKIPN